MYAILRESTYDLDRLAERSQGLDEFQILHSRQPGYQGNVVVDAGGGLLLTLTLWETEEHAVAARSAVGPEAQRILGPMMTRPSQIVGTGAVIVTDLKRK